VGIVADENSSRTLLFLPANVQNKQCYFRRKTMSRNENLSKARLLKFTNQKLIYMEQLWHICAHLFQPVTQSYYETLVLWQGMFLDTQQRTITAHINQVHLLGSRVCVCRTFLITYNAITVLKQNNNYVHKISFPTRTQSHITKDVTNENPRFYLVTQLKWYEKSTLRCFRQTAVMI
jgi:hypothetical protein